MQPLSLPATCNSRDMVVPRKEFGAIVHAVVVAELGEWRNTLVGEKTQVG
jgi:hypothetical protein